MKQKTESEDGKTAFVYMLECSDGTFYTGWTTDADRRVKIHNRGQGAKYTRSRLPVTLVYLERNRGKSECLRREAAIKKLRRSQKKKLICSASNLLLAGRKESGGKGLDPELRIPSGMRSSD
ncbi:MAG: GIY-YIG nuclease family protein [Firmicutes bacterium]|jgi:putative endonuclease|nr:GIY-YIG nuclease family protein [Bacillota bacterium]